MFKLFLIKILLIIFWSVNANAYVMTTPGDPNSIDRFRQCTKDTKSLLPLPLDEGNKIYASYIDKDDILRFNFLEIMRDYAEFLGQLSVSALVMPTPTTDEELTEEIRNSDYNFRITNEKCIAKAAGFLITFKGLLKATQIICNNPRPHTRIKPYPSPISDMKIIFKAFRNIKTEECAMSLTATLTHFAQYMAIEKIMANNAEEAMKRTRLCGHNWTSWNPETFNKDIVGHYQRKVKLCVECRLGLLDQSFCNSTITQAINEEVTNSGSSDTTEETNYKRFCNDNQYNPDINSVIGYGMWKGLSQKKLIEFRKYREYLYRGVEREDRSGNETWDGSLVSIEGMIDSAERGGVEMKYCIDPTKEYDERHGDIMKAYYNHNRKDYEFYDANNETGNYGIFGPFAVQKYYYRGTESTNFNCSKYLSHPTKTIRGSDPEWRDILTSELDIVKTIYNDAYNCCLRKKYNSICVEYATNTDYHDANDDERKGDYYIRKFDKIEADDIDNPEPVTKKNYRICHAEEICSLGDLTPGNPLPLEFDSEYITTADRGLDEGVANNLLCAHTISLCPFDMNIGGGTVVCDGINIDPKKVKSDETCDRSDEMHTNKGCVKNTQIGKCNNYCQMLEHCVVIDTSSDYSHISIDSPYFDKSCFDFKGDSKFTGTASDWTIEESIVPQEIFRLTSPIAQCVRETLRNIFLNRAGHSKCDDDYVGNPDFEYCAVYKWEKGQDLNNVTNDEGDLVYFSVFRFIQDKLYFLIQLFLVLYVMMFGFKILISDTIIPRKEILENCLKIGIVIFFAAGNAWQAVFFDFIYNLSTTLGNIILDLKDTRLIMEGASDDSPQSAQAQKCYFNPETYDPNMQYVSLWDTLDCKLSQYLGLAPGLTYGNLAILIFSGYFTGIYGIYFASLLFTFAIMFFTIIYIVLYMFVVTSTMIIVIIFISPIIMVSILFDHTKDIFENWLKQLLESSTQLIILFSFVSITIFLFDGFFVGSADFKKNNPEPICECQCETKDGQSDENNPRSFIKNGIKECGIANDTGLTNNFVDGITNLNEPTKCAEKYSDAISGLAAGTAPSEDSRLAINCVNIYRDGLCGKGFEIRDPKADSLLCIMRIGNHAVSQSGNLAAFGLIMPVLNIIFSPDRAVTLILTLVKIVLVVYILKIMTGRIAAISSMLWGTKGLPSSIEATIKSLRDKIQSNSKKAVSTTGTVQKYGNRAMNKGGSKTVDAAKDAIKKYKDGNKDKKDSGGDGKDVAKPE